MKPHHLALAPSGPGEIECSSISQASSPLALALVPPVPGLGLFVREAFNTGRVRVFVHHVDLMSPSRLAWMVGVVRGVLFKAHCCNAPCGDLHVVSPVDSVEGGGGWGLYCMCMRLRVRICCVCVCVAVLLCGCGPVRFARATALSSKEN
jgi:hypothetical protein